MLRWNPNFFTQLGGQTIGEDYKIHSHLCNELKRMRYSACSKVLPIKGHIGTNNFCLFHSWERFHINEFSDI